MPRTIGAKNNILFENRRELPTTSSAVIPHLGELGASPLIDFCKLLSHQRNYISWINSRHSELTKTKAKLARLTNASLSIKKEPKGPKEATFEKYTWYTTQVVLLDAINNFEVFYKRTFIGLAIAMHEFVSAEAIKGNVDAKAIWASPGFSNPVTLVFESRLFHNMEAVDDCTGMLVNKRRYSSLKTKVKALQAIFQIRHTLSHNAGQVTKSDTAKFLTYGYKVNPGEIIDPSQDYLVEATFRVLELEAKEFTEWLRNAVVDFLIAGIADDKFEVPIDTKSELKKLLGGDDVFWSCVKWSKSRVITC